ncbi:DUF3703 domain-containing protein [Sphingorhabdus sp.]|uniref:DUF3703 domain-containing protein n=1 Tax=Sphingorhabdus sp. TaxID=1902408 RepID=UPI00359357D0
MALIDHFEHELIAARSAEAMGEVDVAFYHLERAHILGQNTTRLHVQSHVRMLGWAWRQRNRHEFLGQLFRIAGAATKTFIGLVPRGNSGGTNVSPFKPMPIPEDLAAIMEQSGRQS